MSTEHITSKTDRTGWDPGPWDGEPDRLEFIHSGFACLMVRGPVGAWCGYVGVPEAHPSFEKSYDDVNVNVNCGLTYANRCSGDICHVPEPGMPDLVWWLGFDTAHYCDLAPGIVARERAMGWEATPGEVYRDAAYVRAETERLAEQLANIAKGE